MTVSLAPATPADLDALARLAADAQPYAWTAGQLADSLAAGHWLTTAVDGERIAGFAVVHSLFEDAELLEIVVARPCQRRGIARQLLAAAVDHARHAGATRLLLEVRASNDPARALYRTAGFHETGVRRGYYRADHGREDAILMELPL